MIIESTVLIECDDKESFVPLGGGTQGFVNVLVKLNNNE